MNPDTVSTSAVQAPSSFSFSAALSMLKAGERVARAGWNGKGMWLVLVEMWEAFHLAADNKDQRDSEAVKVYCMPALPFIAMKTADDCIVPWLASQTDILATDWVCL